MTVVRELVAFLGFDVDEKELKKAEKAMDDLGRFAKRASIAFAAVGGAIAAATYDLVSFSSQTKDNAERIGVTTDALQELGYAAKVNGGSAEAMGQALASIGEASAGVTERGKKAQAFIQALGVRTREAGGKMRASDAIMTDFAEALARIQDPAKRSATAARILGDSGRELLPLLNKGAAGLEAFRQEARDLGVVIDGDTISAAEELGDTFDRLTSIGRAFTRNIAAAMLPQVKRLADGLLAWYRDNALIIRQRFDYWMRRFSTDVANLVTTFSRFVVLLSRARPLLIALGVALGALGLAYFGAKVKTGYEALTKLIKGVSIFSAAGRRALLVNLLWGASIAFIVLAVQDLITYLNGGDSLIGRFLARFTQPIKPEDTWPVRAMKAFVHYADVGLSKLYDILEAMGLVAQRQKPIDPEEALAGTKRGGAPRFRSFRLEAGRPGALNVGPALPPLAGAAALPPSGPVNDNRQVVVNVNGADADPRAIADEVMRKAAAAIDILTPVTQAR